MIKSLLLSVIIFLGYGISSVSAVYVPFYDGTNNGAWTNIVYQYQTKFTLFTYPIGSIVNPGSNLFVQTSSGVYKNFTTFCHYQLTTTNKSSPSRTELICE